MLHTGGCHCGKVKYEVEMELTTALSCNCSICMKRGSLLAFVSPTSFKLLAGEGATSDYLFNREVIHHIFCKTCGILSYGRTTAPDGKDIVVINVRCLDGFEPSQVKILEHDGRSQ